MQEPIIPAAAPVNPTVTPIHLELSAEQVEQLQAGSEVHIALSTGTFLLSAGPIAAPFRVGADAPGFVGTRVGDATGA